VTSLDPVRPTGPAGRDVVDRKRRLNDSLAPFGFPLLALDERIDLRLRQAEHAAALASLGASVDSAGVTRHRGRRWVLVDKSGQVLAAGDRRGVRFVMPVSTGTTEHETRLVDAVPAFRYEPATENAGWRNSTTFPVDAGHPHGGNMYRPLYFSRGQAIHGADVVPPYPRSQGCVLLTVADQDRLLAWLGLAEATEPLWDERRIDLDVTVRGAFDAGLATDELAANAPLP
jgi:hypothetical protein